jgi:truncated hemoglobin YjbI
MTEQLTPAAPTLYELAGGAGSVRRVGTRLYRWIRADSLLWANVFSLVASGTVEAKFEMWLTAKMDGPSTFKGDMTVHYHWPITAEMFDHVARYLEAAMLVELWPREVIEAVMNVAAGEYGSVVSVESPADLPVAGSPPPPRHQA